MKSTYLPVKIAVQTAFVLFGSTNKLLITQGSSNVLIIAKIKNGDRYFILDIIEFLCNARHKFLLKGANYAKNPETYNK